MHLWNLDKTARTGRTYHTAPTTLLISHLSIDYKDKRLLRFMTHGLNTVYHIWRWLSLCVVVSIYELIRTANIIHESCIVKNMIYCQLKALNNFLSIWKSYYMDCLINDLGFNYSTGNVHTYDLTSRAFA